MNFITFVLDRFKYYSYHDASNAEICILGDFLLCDVRCYNSVYKRWALSDKSDPNVKFSWGINGNVTFLEEEDDGLIHLSSSLPLEDDEKLVVFKLTPKQFIKILDDWEQLVCKLKPKEVIIKYVGDEFIFETKQ